MDQGEFHLQPPGICYKLYHFITKTLASQALKTVTLGGPLHNSSSSTASRGSGSKPGKELQMRPNENYGNKELLPTHGDFLSSLAGQAEKKKNACMNTDEIPTMNMTSLPQAKNVEEIAPSNKKKIRSKSFQN